MARRSAKTITRTLSSGLRLAVAQARELDAAGERGRAATELLELLDGARAELSAVRDVAALDLELGGATVQKVAEAFGVSKARAGQMLKRARSGSMVDHATDRGRVCGGVTGGV